MTNDPLSVSLPAPDRPARGRLWLFLLLLAAASVFALYRSPALRFQGADAVGTSYLTAARVVEAAGLVPGAPRWENSAARIESRLREEPWILTAKAEWEWNRVHITITERTPVALLPYQSKWVLLDETGMIMELVESPAGRKLPVVAGVATNKALRGRQLNHPGLNDALLVVSRMEASFSGQISEVMVKPDRQLVFFMVGGAQIEWGAVPDDPKAREQAVLDRISLFGRVWPGLKKRGPTCRIDMRVPGRADEQGCN